MGGIPVEPLIETSFWFDKMEGWAQADHGPAMDAFRRTCQSWSKANPDELLNPNLPQYGHFRDWLPACDKLLALERDYEGDSNREARSFFESEFSPLSLITSTETEGLLTGY